MHITFIYTYIFDAKTCNGARRNNQERWQGGQLRSRQGMIGQMMLKPLTNYPRPAHAAACALLFASMSK